MISTAVVDGSTRFIEKYVTRKHVKGEWKVVAITRLLDNLTMLPVAILEERIVGPAAKR